MKPTFSHIASTVAFSLFTLFFQATSVLAFPNYGPPVDTFCTSYNGTTPYTDQSCLLCHTTPSGGPLNSTGTAFSGTHTPSASMCPVKNTAPVSNAGPNQTVALGTTVTLDGTKSSDVDGNTLTYHWLFTSIPTGSGAHLSNATAAKPTFLADKAGQYVAQLIVNDGIVNSTPATVTISTANTAPVANAGRNQTAAVGATVTLDGSGSTDPDGNPLTYQWSFSKVPTGSKATLLAPTTMKPTFSVDLSGDYTVQLIVNDGKINSAPATVIITTANTAPVANAGLDQSVTAGSTVTLDGSGSTDVDGNALQYDWVFQSVPMGSTSTFSNPTAAKPTFVADKVGQYVAQLIVNDGTANSLADTVTISTTGINTAPIANAGPDQTVNAGSTVQLDGSGCKDADGNALHYQWSFTTKPVGSKSTLSNATTMMASFVADVAGQYAAQLVVNDGQVNSSPDTVAITTLGGNTTPIANAGPDQSVAVGTVVTLDGSGSKDPDGTSLTYQWTLTKPLNSTASLSDPSAVHPTFAVDLSGEYIAQLIVSDGTASSAPDTVMVKTTTLPQASGIYIQRAKWNDATGKLMVVGRGPKNAAVDIRDASSGAVLTTVMAGDAGRFRAYFPPQPIPCALQAASNGLLSEKTPIMGAPTNCALTGAAPTVSQGYERERESTDRYSRNRPRR